MIHRALLAMLAIKLLTSLAMPMILQPITDEDLIFFERSLDKRGLQHPMKGLPACNSYEGDPTWAVDKSTWQDGQGVTVGDDCDNRKGGKDHCWYDITHHRVVSLLFTSDRTDYFVVGTTKQYRPWYELSEGMQCPANGSCTRGIGTITQSCTTYSVSVSYTVSAAFATKFSEIGVSSTKEWGQANTTCNTNTTANTCSWTDGGCQYVLLLNKFSSL
jgi:hypothetical protein